MTEELVLSATQPARTRRAPLMARNLGHPRGIAGHLTGRLMVRGNDALNEWVVDRLADRHETGISRITEIGPGPGVGLRYLLSAFPAAQVWGIDHSAVMVRQARRNNSDAVRGGRLNVMRGDLDALAALAPVDLVLAVNVLYFWADPCSELQKIRRALRDDGTMCLGYQLRRHMSPKVQQAFPSAGHRLYDADEHVTELLLESGFRKVEVWTSGPHRMQLGFNGSLGRF